MNARIAALKDAFLAAPRMADTERAVQVTESYREHENRSGPMKRALSLRRILDNQTIAIHDNELIVGCHSQNIRGTPLFPDYAGGWISAQMDDFMTRPGDRFVITEEQKATMRECLEYWKGRSLDERVMACVPDEIKEALSYNIIYNVSYASKSPGHLVPHFEYLLQTGFVFPPDVINGYIVSAYIVSY